MKTPRMSCAAGLFCVLLGVSDPAQAQQRPTCAAMQTLTIPKGAIGLPTGGAVIQSATEVGDEAGRQYCRIIGWIRPINPAGLPINFQVNLPAKWNGKAVHFGGAGFDGVVVSATGAAQRGGEPPLNRGYVTLGSDSGHSSALGPTFGLDDEALENYAFAAIKKTHDVAVALIKARYGTAPSPLCEFGTFPKYLGAGDPNFAEGFTCAPATVARPPGARGRTP